MEVIAMRAFLILGFDFPERRLPAPGSRPTRGASDLGKFPGLPWHGVDRKFSGILREPGFFLV
jgi:hypothetical protein